MMKYLFCMFLLIHNRDEIKSFKSRIIAVLDEIMATSSLTSDPNETFIFIMSSFYNNNLSYKRGLSFKLNGTFWLNSIIGKYHLDALEETFNPDMFMDIRKYLVNCEEKAVYEYKCLQNDPTYRITYDPTTQSLQYIKNLQCSPTFIHFASVKCGVHQCCTQLTDVDFVMKGNQITFSYKIDGSQPREEKKYMSSIFSMFS